MKSILRMARHLGEGVALGLANIIPGVSGGTIALILGIYEKLVGAASDAVRHAARFLRLDVRGAARGLAGLPWAFLLPVVLAMVATPFLAAGWMEQQLANRPEIMRGIFLGLVAGSVAVPWIRIRRRGGARLVLAVAAAVAAWLLVGLPPREVTNPTDLQVFLAAVFAISAMVLPGISGSFLLLVLGMYAPTLSALDALDLRYIAVFAAGAALGLAGFAVLLAWLLERFHDETMAVLVGLMVGSLRALWPWQTAGSLRMPGEADPMAGVVFWTVAALALSIVFSLVEIRRLRGSLTDAA